jgi:hypothetical protein
MPKKGLIMAILILSEHLMSHPSKGMSNSNEFIVGTLFLPKSIVCAMCRCVRECERVNRRERERERKEKCIKKNGQR